MSSYQYRDPHFKYKAVVILTWEYPYQKRRSLSWDGVLEPVIPGGPLTIWFWNLVYYSTTMLLRCLPEHRAVGKSNYKSRGTFVCKTWPAQNDRYLTNNHLMHCLKTVLFQRTRIDFGHKSLPEPIITKTSDTMYRRMATISKSLRQKWYHAHRSCFRCL